jgi:hypothetical protein
MLVLCGLLAGCGGGPLSLLTGGGPNVAANVQAGAENRQSAVSVERQAPQPRLSFGLGSTVTGVTQTTEQAQTRAETIQTYNANPPVWVWLLLVLGWLLPSPGEIWRGIVSAFRR